MSDKQTTIRLYHDRDRAQVSALWQQGLIQSKPHQDIDLCIQQKMAFQPELFFVAERSGQVVATLMGGYDGHRGWMYSLAVEEKFRRQGIAQALVVHLEEALRQLGCCKLNLQVYVGNDQALEFYQSIGYSSDHIIGLGKVL